MNKEGAIARLTPGLARFLRWWWRCLVSWLPERWQALVHGSRERVLLSQKSDELSIRWQGSGPLRELVRVPAVPEAVELDKLLGPRLAGVPRWWLLEDRMGLRRSLRLPANAGRYLHKIAGLEVDRQTPFAADAVHYDVRVIGRHHQGELEVELVVVPKQVIDALARSVSAMELTGIDLADAGGQPLGVNLLPAATRRQRADPIRRWNGLFAAIAVLAIAAAAAQILNNRRETAARLEARVEAQSSQAQQVAEQRRVLAELIEGATFLDDARASRPTVVEVWDELTRRLPPGTYLERLSIHGERLQLTGFSGEASSLVERMEGSALWRRPALSGTLHTDPGSDRERFTLTAELNGAGVDLPGGR